jgi:uncharacterized membrane protein YkgB
VWFAETPADAARRYEALSMQAPRSYARLIHHNQLIRFEGRVHGWLVQHSITVLRISLGAIFLGFGILKLVPGLSPAEDLVESTISVMTLGLLPDQVGLVITAAIECFIGASLMAGRWLRLTVYLLAVELLGVLSPLVLLPGRLFDGPHHAPTLEGQYVLKDIVLVAAAMVISTQFRGAEIVAPQDWDLDLDLGRASVVAEDEK